MDDLTDLLFFLLISANKLPLTSVSLFTQTYNTYSISITPHYCSTMKSLMVSRAAMVTWNRTAVVKLLLNVIPFHSRTFELTFVS